MKASALLRLSFSGVTSVVQKPVNHGHKQTVDLVAFCRLLFTAQPEAPAVVLAGASGWAVND
jgi:hypothetical protein